MILATYNAHDGVGTDGVLNIGRISQVICETGAEIIALQEISGPGGGPSSKPDHFQDLAHAFGGYAVSGPAIQNEDRRYGNLLLSRWPILDWRIADLAHPSREPRNAITAIVDAPSGPLRIIASHFGLSYRERKTQAGLIGALAADHETLPTVVLGDFNDWPPFSPAVRLLSRSLGRRLREVPRIPTFPSRWPLLALDRILVGSGIRIEDVWVPATSLVRQASDHRPLVAQLAISSPPDRSSDRR